MSNLTKEEQVNRSSVSRLAPIAALLAAASAFAAAGVAKPPPKSSGPSIAFSQPSYVDTTLAGGEPIVMADTLHGCSATEIPDNGTSARHGFYGGSGKPFFDSTKSRLVEPVIFGDGLGVGTWNRGDAAFTPHFAVKTSLFAHWPSIALDSANTIYLVWDTNEPSTSPNTIKYAYSKDFGTSWSAPVTVAAPADARVFWPWIVATRGRSRSSGTRRIRASSSISTARRRTSRSTRRA